MRRFAYAALLAAAVSATPALAQDAAPPAASPTGNSPLTPFTGLRVEGLVGWDRVQDFGHDDAVMYGVGVGYDRQFGGVLVGVEGELNDSDARACDGLGTAADPRLCVKAGRDLYAGGRVGTVVGGRALLYAKAGYTNARAKLTQGTGSGQITLDRTDLDGVRVGAGAEYAVGSNAFVKAEYRYSNYEAGVERHQIVGGFGFRF